jgi:predicted nucleic acid-binding protein
MSLAYLDTSVLAKRYLHTPVSEKVERLLDRPDLEFMLSELCLVEMESTLVQQARVRAAKIDVPTLRLRFRNDVQSGFFQLSPVDRSCVLAAQQLIAESAMPLRTLDALHLASAVQAQADTFITDDRQLARAAKACQLTVISFV